MNRIILIGNGFDLAHGLPTSYKDFIKWYLKKALQNSLETDGHKDALFRIKFNPRARRPFDLKERLTRVVDDYYNSDNLMALIDNKSNIADGLYGGVEAMFIASEVTDFFRNLLKSCTRSNWVDIENVYYQELTKILTIHAEGDKSKRLAHLNKALKVIIERLHEYLHTLTYPSYNSSFLKILQSDVYSRPVSNVQRKDSTPEDTLIVNFNYTPTVEPYMKKFNLIHQKLNYIHGNIIDMKTMVFGFGDELDRNYQAMQDSNIEGFLDYMKTFWYLRTSKYQEVLGFLEEKQFEVMILGLSCGLSDRTLLHTIFEHDNCKFIKIYHYTDSKGENNFVPLTHSIARHFKFNEKLRSRIVPYTPGFSIPQI